uniref:Uncharacterized protein n=1 Tax=Anguilla anguilla TaxID=7936 RepID=A0A0E9PZL8_ANGAN
MRFLNFTRNPIHVINMQEQPYTNTDKKKL